jgi:hypothetical protein
MVPEMGMTGTVRLTPTLTMVQKRVAESAAEAAGSRTGGLHAGGKTLYGVGLAAAGSGCTSRNFWTRLLPKSAT